MRVASVGSPENWFEDFGSGTLSAGVAQISLEPVFASTVNTAETYRVFLTPNGDCRGLSVANKTATGFEVRELGGGASNVSFDYRIVAKRAGFENARLQDVTGQMKQLRQQGEKMLSKSSTRSAAHVEPPEPLPALN